MKTQAFTLPACFGHAVCLFLATALTTLTRPVMAQPLDVEAIAWEHPHVTNIRGAEELLAELRYQVQRVLDRGHLAPLYISYADQESVGYTVYQEPGRIVTTLAYAFPHLGSEQKARVTAYVREEFSNPTNAPWGVTSYGKNGNSNYPLPRTAGVPREDHPRERWWYERSDFGNARPFLQTLYGVWLYGHVTGDWQLLSDHWDAMRRLYENYGASDTYRLYGTMGTHVAVLRLAHRFADHLTQSTAFTRLQTGLQAGLDFASVESITRGTPGEEWRSPYGSYPNMYDPRMASSTYHGWMFLNLTPELGRYLASFNPTLRSAVLERHAEGNNRFPFWWIPKAGYFNRSWTGDEGSGLVPELLGMLAPVERWVVQADSGTLRQQMRGAPNGVGDCYWLEALVQAIEAHGTLRWVDVRSVPAVLRDARQVPPDQFRLTVTGAEGEQYILQLSTNLATWTDLTTNPAPFEFTGSLANVPVQFYRAR